MVCREQKADTEMVYLSLVLILAVPFGVMALAVSRDTRSRRGYGLGLLSAVTLILEAV